MQLTWCVPIARSLQCSGSLLCIDTRFTSACIVLLTFTTAAVTQAAVVVVVVIVVVVVVVVVAMIEEGKEVVVVIKVEQLSLKQGSITLRVTGPTDIVQVFHITTSRLGVR
jgi:hypothetical protein